MTKVLLFIFTTIQVVSLSNSLLQTRSCLQRFSTALPAIGSDILQRPEDEESAEYRDYLKNLMKMQANRARSGHSAPSSGSSDAYFAKLSRLKVERQALARAGLPESVLDTSYTQEDYDSAIYEAQEPLISATVLSGEAAIASRNKKHNTKQRSLTQEELDMEEVANRRVEEVLKTQMALPPSQRATMAKVVETRQISNLEPSPELDLIDDLLTRRSLIPARPPVRAEQQQQPRPVRITPPAPVSAKAAPVEEVVAVKKVSAVPLRPLAAAPVVTPPAATPPPVKAVVRSVPAPPVAAAAVSPPVPSSPKNLLQPADLELMAKSLQMLVKHRGGGPFGAGRLQTPKDISEMEVSIMNTVSMLTKLDGVAPAAAPVRVAPVRAAPAPTPAAVAPKAVAPVARTVPAPAVQVKVAAPVQATRVAQVQAPVQSGTEGEAEAPMTIAQGLDQFLSAPQLRSYEELEGLRDGLIQCLYMVQQELTSRPPLESPADARNSVADEAEAVERIMRINAPATAVSTDLESTAVSKEIPLEQDVKLALGLLLKHRGGPGFGHGRLVGKELDLMAAKLRSVSQRLVAESISAEN